MMMWVNRDRLPDAVLVASDFLPSKKMVYFIVSDIPSLIPLL
jgi:hypothetical protein